MLNTSVVSHWVSVRARPGHGAQLGARLSSLIQPVRRRVGLPALRAAEVSDRRRLLGHHRHLGRPLSNERLVRRP